MLRFVQKARTFSHIQYNSNNRCLRTTLADIISQFFPVPLKLSLLPIFDIPTSVIFLKQILIQFTAIFPYHPIRFEWLVICSFK